MSWFRSLLLSVMADGQVLRRSGKNLVGAEISTLTPAGNWLPDATGTRDLGVTGTRWRDLFLSRNATVGGTLAVTGDLTAGGGFRQTVTGWGYESVAAGDNATPASATAVPIGLVGVQAPFVAKRAGSITGLGFALSADPAGSAIIVAVSINGTVQAGTAVTLAAGSTRHASATFAKDAIPFAAGDLLRVVVRTGSGWSASSANLVADVEIES